MTINKQKRKAVIFNPLDLTRLNNDPNEIGNRIKTIITTFYNEHLEKEKFINFQHHFDNDYLDCLFKMSHFPEFNFFEEYKKVNYIVDNKECQNLLIQRNNFFILCLIHFDREKHHTKMDMLVEKFVDLNMKMAINLDLAVDFFFLCYYDYRFYGTSLVLENFQYFQKIMKKDEVFSIETFSDFIRYKMIE